MLSLLSEKALGKGDWKGRVDDGGREGGDGRHGRQQRGRYALLTVAVSSYGGSEQTHRVLWCSMRACAAWHSRNCVMFQININNITHTKLYMSATRFSSSPPHHHCIRIHIPQSPITSFIFQPLLCLASNPGRQQLVDRLIHHLHLSRPTHMWHLTS